MTRPTCITCNAPAAINYRKKGKIYYRRFCDSCVREKKKPNAFKVQGYHKSNTCDHCGYKSKYPDSFLIWYLDGNKSNTRIANLKTVCLNCKITLGREGWKKIAGDLIEDV
jgi:hypothetical protein